MAYKPKTPTVPATRSVAEKRAVVAPLCLLSLCKKADEAISDNKITNKEYRDIEIAIELYKK